MDSGSLTRRIRNDLQGTFGARLEGVVLYGSEARGEAGPDSDIDVLVLLKGPVALWEDARSAALALQSIVSDLGRAIHAVPVDAEAYAAREYGLYREASREGIRA
ncbi:MAG: nucleotidyltransferase domain-containing protein [Deltaproteobacteria bacterium]|nr:nucleotidyltransferase domain-containing protein [Deltaproteobacteria bacterium]